MRYETYTRYRDKAKKNDRQVSMATGIATATLCEWKNKSNGKHGYIPKMDKQLVIAKFLKIPLKEVIGNDT